MGIWTEKQAPLDGQLVTVMASCGRLLPDDVTADARDDSLRHVDHPFGGLRW
jgi:hypothetical protein